MLHASDRTASPRILVIRRDNIGDLVCTTPLFSVLRTHFPTAWIGAWVNSYNAPVLDHNPDVDEVFIYTKAKHRAVDQSLAGIYWQKLQMLRRLRKHRLDVVIIATTQPQPRLVRMARWLNPKRIIAFGPCGADTELPLCADASRHEVEDVLRAASELGCTIPPEHDLPCRVFSPGSTLASSTVGIHISARKVSQRWPAERFVALMQALLANDSSVNFKLLWAPGKEDDPLHPGDDHKAAAILSALPSGFPVQPQATHTLPELIGALAECSMLICADGGAMHLGAGLGLPIVCLFGNSGSARWRPWGVPYQLLQPASLDVKDIAVSDVVDAFSSLQAGTRAVAAADKP